VNQGNRMTPEEIIEQLRAEFGDALKQTELRGQEALLVVAQDQSYELCHVLKEMGFEYLNCLSGVDYRDRFEVVYHLSSLEEKLKVTVKVPLPHEDPVVRSVTSLWRGADWHEREAYDLLGIRFQGHPDLRRILLPEDWEGHPLRKDYEDDRLVPYKPV